MGNHDCNDLRGLGRNTSQRGIDYGSELPRRRLGTLVSASVSAPTMAPTPSYAPPTAGSDAKDALIAKLRNDVKVLADRILNFAKPPRPGEAPSGLQIQYQAMLKRVLTAEAAAKNAGGPGTAGQAAALTAANALVTKLRADVAELSRRIQTYNQPPAPGQQASGLQLAYQNLIRQIQTLQAWKTAHGG